MIRHDEYHTASKLLKILVFLTLSCHVFAEDVDKNQKVEVRGIDTRAHAFAESGDVVELMELAEEDTDILFVADKNKWTPLHEASRQGNVLAISFLIENGADPLAKNIQGQIPRDLLFDPNVIAEIAEEPDEEEDDINARYELSQIILEHAEKGLAIDGVPINREELAKETEDFIGDSAHLANSLVHFGLRWTLEELFLLDEDAFEHEDGNGWTPLHEAMRFGNMDIISYLIRHGADMYSETDLGYTPLDIGLHFADKVGSTTHIELLRLEMERAPEEL